MRCTFTSICMATEHEEEEDSEHEKWREEKKHGGLSLIESQSRPMVESSTIDLWLI